MITYPVNIENTRWSLHDGKGVVRENFRWPSEDKNGNGVEIPELPETATMLLHVAGGKPSFDPATEKLVPADPVVDLDANTVTTAWDVVPLTTAEADAATRAAQRSAMRADFDALPDHLRGGFRVQFEIANLLLERGDDVFAREMLDFVEPTALVKGDAAKKAQYDAVKAAFQAKISALKPLP